MRLLSISATVFLTILPVQAQNNPNLRLSPAALSFQAIQDGPPPVRQAISLVTLDASAIEYSLMVDGGSPGAPIPGWITVSPRRATTPTRILVTVDATGLASGSAPSARILVTDPTGVLIAPPIPATLDVVESPAALAVHPPVIRFRGQQGAVRSLEAPLSVLNSGSGEAPEFAVAVESESGWLRAGDVTCNPECRLSAIAQTRDLVPGGYLGHVSISSDIGDFEVAVPLAVSAVGPDLQVEPRGLRFEVRDGQTRTVDRSVRLVNSSFEPVEWLVEIPQGSDWLTTTPTTGAVRARDSDVVRFVVDPTGLGLGVHHALVRFRVLGRDIAQHVTVLLRVSESGQIGPTVSSEGFLFKTIVGQPTVNVRNLTLVTSSETEVRYQSSALVSSSVATSWLGVSPARGLATSDAPAQLIVSASGTELPTGVFDGKIDIAVDSGVVRSVNATLVVSPPANSACAPRDIAAAHISLLDNFETRVGEPTPVAVELSDNCGTPVDGAVVTVSFTTLDPEVTLTDTGDGIYAGVWVPITPTADLPVNQLELRARISAPGLRPTEWILTGSVLPDEEVTFLATDGVAHNAWPRIGGPLAPGIPVQIFGQELARGGLATRIENSRLPTQGIGTSVLAGLRPAPLYFVGPNQITAQLPAEMEPGREHQLIVNNNGALTVAEDLRINPVAPGVVTFPGGAAIAQDLSFNLINESNPIGAGEWVTVYLVGMGATDPGVPSGTLPPEAPPFAAAMVQPEITLAGRPITEIFFAGMSPCCVALFQTTFFIPPDTPPGNQRLTFRQGLIFANESTLPIK
ncbi:MAG: hypothetical protein GY953_07735 [bacterium]|nr:hypothetical protein [bacterium]